MCIVTVERVYYIVSKITTRTTQFTIYSVCFSRGGEDAAAQTSSASRGGVIDLQTTSGANSISLTDRGLRHTIYLDRLGNAG